MVDRVQVKDGDDSLGRNLVMFDERRSSVFYAELHVGATTESCLVFGALEPVGSVSEIRDLLAAAHACVEIDPDLVEVMATFGFAGCGPRRLHCR